MSLAAMSACQPVNNAPIAEFSDCESCPTMVVVSGGSFQMGSLEGEEGRSEGPIHNVTIDYRFAVGKYEVTYGQFAKFARETNHTPAKNCTIWAGHQWAVVEGTSWQNPGYGRTVTENEPVSCVSWHDAKAYISWLSAKTGKPYRLLSESEWEYVARAGTSTRFFWGDSADEICRHANVFDKSGGHASDLASGRQVSDLAYMPADCDDGYAFTAPVGSFGPNAFGLFDVTGNVWEWTEDCYTVPYPPDVADGRSYQAKGVCERRSIRGGGWITPPARQRPTFRGRDPADLVFSPFGFRVAQDLQ